jgi:hypothetical protein
MRASCWVRLGHARRSLRSDARRSVVVAAFLGLLLASVAGCSHQEDNSSCGWLYDVSGAGRHMTPGACAGSLGATTSYRVRIHPGDNLTVTLPGDDAFTMWDPRPRSEDASVLRLAEHTARKATYLAGQPGRTRLVATTEYCGSYPTTDPSPSSWHTCPLVVVTVSR